MPPVGYGDTDPRFIAISNRLTWVRYNRRQADVWMSNSDGTGAKVWIKDLQTSGYNIERDEWSRVLSLKGSIKH
jgi:hypothetical protein